MKIVTIGFAIAISAQVAAGLGKHQSALDTQKVSHFEQVSPRNTIANTLLCSGLMDLGL